MEIKEEKAFTFIWKIENFSHCLHEPDHKLLSPVFVINSLFNSRWCVRVYPGGQGGQGEFLKFYLVNVTNEDCKITIHYQISLLDIDNTLVHNYKTRDKEFRYNVGHGAINCYPSLKEVYETKRSTYLPQDTLTIVCRLWKTDGDFEEDVQCFARSRIGVERMSKLWSIQDFSKITVDDALSTTVSYNNCSNSIILKMSLSSSLLEEWLQIQINQEKSSKHSQLLCKISLLNQFGKSVKEMEDKHRFLPQKEHIWIFGQFISKRELVEKKSDLLFQDALSLKYEFTFSFGEVVYEKIESSHIGLPSLQIPELNHLTRSFPEPTPEAYHCHHTDLETENLLSGDLLSLYHEKALSDFELNVEGVPFPVHKAILYARSPVFKAMLTSDMQESDSKSLNVPDVDADTLTKLLLYVYTGTFENMNSESIFKLYYAADEYQVLPLKQKCSSSMISNLTVPNVSMTLTIADRHQDNELTSAVNDFILDHDEEIMESAEWLEFVKSDSQLAAKTMHQVYRKKLKMKPS